MLILSKEEVQRLRQGEFELDCPKIVLERRLTEGADSFSGPGFIRQSSDGEMHFRLYSEATAREQAREIQDTLLATPGTLISADECYILKATDLRGREWTSSPIPSPSQSWGKGVVVSGRVTDLRCREDRPGAGSRGFLRFTVCDRVRIPVNAMTKTKVTVAGK